MSSGVGPLAGLTVLAAEQMISLPHATQLLTFLGAEVIKVEPLAGEAGRHGRPTVRDPDGRDVGSTFIRNNLNKASIALDLKSDRGRELFFELARGVDVVAENFRPGAADALGIGYAALSARDPSIVYVSISGFGHRDDPPSPYRERAAYAPVVEAMSGLYEYAREDDGPPRLASAGALGDTGPSLYAVIGLLAALHERGRTGRGCHVDVSMYDSMVAIADVVHLASMGIDPSRATVGIGIIHAFRAKDGWFTLEVIRDPHFPILADAVGHPEWKDDPRLRSREGWWEHMEGVLRPGIEAWARGKTKVEASAELARRGLAAGPVNRAADIEADPHVRSRGLVHHIENPDGGPTPAVVGSPIHFRRAEAGASEKGLGARRWPMLGGDTDRVLSERLGLSSAEVEALRRDGIVA